MLRYIVLTSTKIKIGQRHLACVDTFAIIKQRVGLCELGVGVEGFFGDFTITFVLFD